MATLFGETWNWLDDVEDHQWVGELELNGCFQKGVLALKENRMQEAINFYSNAHNLKPNDPVILSNRSIAFIRISLFLKTRPASVSEYQPVNGLDPTTHAELALKDAEKVINCRSYSAKSYLLKAGALMLLERYEEARETLLSGLHVDPLSEHLQLTLQSLQSISVGSIRRNNHGRPQHTDEFDCTLCYKLLYEPITTPCGHSFCRSCLFQSMDHGNKCPMCRTVLFISPKTYSISVTLNNIIEKNFPEEYAERKSEHDGLTNLGVDLIPLFVMDVVLPCQKLALNIFEPRYRLMVTCFCSSSSSIFLLLDLKGDEVRRIMEGNRRMGMVIIDSATGSVADFACEVEITECEPLPDGRFYLEVEGRRRFRIIRSCDQDGYRVAEVEWVNDSHLPEGSAERGELQEIVGRAANAARAWIRQVKEAAMTGRRSRRLENLQVEGMPGLHDPERFSFWLANLFNLRPSDRLELLRLRDTRQVI
ncbi:hypothetical protein GIB67_007295 [Kingdonia uniflora]|uniref:Uncharacterized protein n=1 Tax=Kingdonia uniflora TaxID=39325 RepID=A0A7J7NXV5_9MAGN|nr:hypothetical protein GIB67_007295 [Kingdonia uniflora]